MPVYKTIDELPIELNIRDLGGLEARDGRHVRSGLLFRSASPYFFNEEQLEPVKGRKPPVSICIHSGTGWISMWSTWPRPTTRLIHSQLQLPSIIVVKPSASVKKPSIHRISSAFN